MTYWGFIEEHQQDDTMSTDGDNSTDESGATSSDSKRFSPELVNAAAVVRFGTTLGQQLDVIRLYSPNHATIETEEAD